VFMKDGSNQCGMREELMSYLYGEASSDEVARIEPHLNRCQSCRDELNAFERVRGMLQKWQLEDLPIVRVAVEPRRSFVDALKELMSVAPLWAKIGSVAAAALLLLAVFGTELSVGRNGVSVRADLLRRHQTNDGQQPVEFQAEDLERVRADVRSLVNQLVTESEKQRNEELQTQLAAFESEIATMRSADLARLATRIQEHQVKIRTLERDIDRREGADLTDILFGEMTTSSRDSKGSGD